MYVLPSTETRSYNHCCCGNAITITYSKRVFVALVIQRAKVVRHIVVCALSGFSIFFSLYLINDTIFEIKSIAEYKICNIHVRVTVHH